MMYTTGFICSAFDLFHAGHVLMLEECKRQCRVLIVGLHIDPSIERPEKNKPIQSVVERQIQLRGCKYVDQIVVYETETDLKIILDMIEPDVRFLGSDYADGKKLATYQDAYKIVYLKRNHPYSSSELRKRIKSVV